MTKKITVKRFQVGSVAKFIGTINAVISVFVGLVAAFGAIISLVAKEDHSTLEAFGLSVGIIAAGLLVYPLVMFLFGWLYGALMALVFNLFAGFSGGIAVDVEETDVK